MQAIARNATAVFVNVPFDVDHEYLYLSLITSLVAFGLTPRSVLEVPTNKDRVTRLVELLRTCRYSLHDLSCVHLSDRPFRVPRFNMPFELGVAVAISAIEGDHDFRILEERPYRVQQSLSDCAGYDYFVHRGSAQGVFEAVSAVFANLPNPFTNGGFRKAYNQVRKYRRTKIGNDVYSPRSFGELVLAARSIVERLGR